MTKVAVTEAGGGALPQPGNHVSHLSCQVVLPLSGRTERAATGALALCKAFHATLAGIRQEGSHSSAFATATPVSSQCAVPTACPVQ
jgi:hypothetical protein